MFKPIGGVTILTVKFTFSENVHGVQCDGEKNDGCMFFIYRKELIQACIQNPVCMSII